MQLLSLLVFHRLHSYQLLASLRLYFDRFPLVPLRISYFFVLSTGHKVHESTEYYWLTQSDERYEQGKVYGVVEHWVHVLPNMDRSEHVQPVHEEEGIQRNERDVHHYVANQNYSFELAASSLSFQEEKYPNYENKRCQSKHGNQNGPVCSNYFEITYSVLNQKETGYTYRRYKRYCNDVDPISFPLWVEWVLDDPE